MVIRRILVPVDYSECSTNALAYAGGLAERFSSRIEVIHVWDRPAYVPENALVAMHESHGSLPELIRENAEREMQEFLDGCELPALVHVTHHLLGGDPVAKILECAANGYQLLIVGTHGRSGLRHLLLGSVAERIVQLSPVPVITVPLPRE
jgi:nucleotide-binding universal stress UspA family protein